MLINCKACPFTATSSLQLKQHICTSSGKGSLACHFCERNFVSKATLRDHLKKHDDSDFQCGKCKTPFAKRAHLKRHEAACRVQPTCQSCGCQFAQWSDLKIHLDSHAEAQLFSCQHCNETFSYQANLDRHMSLHVNSQATRGHFPCKFCQALFPSKQDMLDHQLTHFTQEQHCCTKCSKTFATQALLLKHAVEHEAKLYSCQECHQAYNSIKALNEHKLTHAKRLPYACRFCKQEFSSKEAMFDHQLRHNKVSKKHYCEACSKPFKTKSQLEKHFDTKIHKAKLSKSDTLQCLECNQIFDSSQGLASHKRSHIKIYTCKTCDKTFEKAALLSKHEYEEHLLPCSACNLFFTQEEKRLDHIKNSHGNIVMDEKVSAGERNSAELMDHEGSDTDPTVTIIPKQGLGDIPAETLEAPSTYQLDLVNLLPSELAMEDGLLESADKPQEDFSDKFGSMFDPDFLSFLN